jgi:hypothetical protein
MKSVANRFLSIIMKLFLLVFFMHASPTSAQAQKSISIFTGSENPKIQFAVGEMKKVFRQIDIEVKVSDFSGSDMAFLTIAELEKTCEAVE